MDYDREKSSKDYLRTCFRLKTTHFKSYAGRIRIDLLKKCKTRSSYNPK
jgi:hypothetical protein